ncbi:helix-turn-helix domain-containing protein [Nocardia takedensis]|uniref:helix-turn-helix domain-containing protein n=1 Tax=Nocardia takedensis TaxID=259390 RepID=UPI000314FBDF|nr:helix-turn-helix transcriptional regulator [Nocardia takedensis]
MTLLREAIGDSLRRARLAQHRTLREVSTSARVSLGYLSEVERGRKEASSELLAAICAALDVPLSRVLWDVSTIMAGDDAVPVNGSADIPAAEAAPAEAGSDAAAVPVESAEPGGSGSAPAAASMSAEAGAAPPEQGERLARIAERTRIVIPAPKSDMLVLVKSN